MRRLDQRRVRSGWQLDKARHEIRWGDQRLDLTATEFRIARRLVERLGELVEHDELLSYAWPNVRDPDQLWLKPHLARLSDKLRAVGAPVPVAVRGVGYRLDAEGGDEPRPAELPPQPGSAARRNPIGTEETPPRR